MSGYLKTLYYRPWRRWERYAVYAVVFFVLRFGVGAVVSLVEWVMR